MPDVVDQQTRSRMMAGIRAKNTDPEMQVRRALHARGFRFRLHSSALPGKPDLILAKYRAVVFVHGCFWHGHDCHLGRPAPATRREFWTAKIERNRQRDAQVRLKTEQARWRAATVWECAIRGRTRIGLDEAVRMLSEWLPEKDSPSIEIRGAA